MKIHVAEFLPLIVYPFNLEEIYANGNTGSRISFPDFSRHGGWKKTRAVFYVCPSYLQRETTMVTSCLL